MTARGHGVVGHRGHRPARGVPRRRRLGPAVASGLGGGSARRHLAADLCHRHRRPRAVARVRAAG